LLLRRVHLSEASELLSDLRFGEEEQVALKVFLLEMPLGVRLELEAGLVVLAAALLHHHEPARVSAPLPMMVVAAALNRLRDSEISNDVSQDAAVLLDMLEGYRV